MHNTVTWMTGTERSAYVHPRTLANDGLDKWTYIDKTGAQQRLLVDPQIIGSEESVRTTVMQRCECAQCKHCVNMDQDWPGWELTMDDATHLTIAGAQESLLTENTHHPEIHGSKAGQPEAKTTPLKDIKQGDSPPAVLKEEPEVVSSWKEGPEVVLRKKEPGASDLPATPSLKLESMLQDRPGLIDMLTQSPSALEALQQLITEAATKKEHVLEASKAWSPEIGEACYVTHGGDSTSHGNITSVCVVTGVLNDTESLPDACARETQFKVTTAQWGELVCPVVIMEEGATLNSMLENSLTGLSGLSRIPAEEFLCTETVPVWDPDRAKMAWQLMDEEQKSSHTSRCLEASPLFDKQDLDMIRKDFSQSRQRGLQVAGAIGLQQWLESYQYGLYADPGTTSRIMFFKEDNRKTTELRISLSAEMSNLTGNVVSATQLIDVDDKTSALGVTKMLLRDIVDHLARSRRMELWRQSHQAIQEREAAIKQAGEQEQRGLQPEQTKAIGSLYQWQQDTAALAAKTPALEREIERLMASLVEARNANQAGRNSAYRNTTTEQARETAQAREIDQLRQRVVSLEQECLAARDSIQIAETSRDLFIIEWLNQTGKDNTFEAYQKGTKRRVKSIPPVDRIRMYRHGVSKCKNSNMKGLDAMKEAMEAQTATSDEEHITQAALCGDCGQEVFKISDTLTVHSTRFESHENMRLPIEQQSEVSVCAPAPECEACKPLMAHWGADMREHVNFPHMATQCPLDDRVFTRAYSLLKKAADQPTDKRPASTVDADDQPSAKKTKTGGNQKR